jgi:5'-nucleotidase
MLKSRRDFIKNTSLIAGASLCYPAFAGLSEDFTDITILHTNDVHSHIDPFPKNHSKFALQGGAAKRAELINSIRKQNPNTLLLDAGDIFQGTPYFNLYHGKIEYDIMNYMQYDVATIGNHDFDIGIDGLVNQLKRANFKTVNANYIIKGTDLEEFVEPYQIIEKENVKIGVYGLGIALKGLVPEKLCKGVQYTDPISTMHRTEKLLKEQGCDIVICLSHLGYKYKEKNVCDLALAEETKHTDIIIGGHTHTFLEKAFKTVNKNKKEVIVNQAGWAGLILGRIDIRIAKNKNEVTLLTSNNQSLS